MFSNIKKWDPKKLLSEADTYLRSSTNANNDNPSNSAQGSPRLAHTDASKQQLRTPTPARASPSSPRSPSRRTSPRRNKNDGVGGGGSVGEGNKVAKQLDLSTIPREQLIHELKISQSQFLRYRQRLSDVVGAYKSLHAEHQALQLSFDALTRQDEVKEGETESRGDSGILKVDQLNLEAVECDTEADTTVQHKNVLSGDTNSNTHELDAIVGAIAVSDDSPPVQLATLSTVKGNLAVDEGDLVHIDVDNVKGMTSESSSSAKHDAATESKDVEVVITGLIGIDESSKDEIAESNNKIKKREGKDNVDGEVENLKESLQTERKQSSSSAGSAASVTKELNIARAKIAKLEEQLATVAFSLSVIAKEKSAMQRDFQDDKRKLLEKSRQALKSLESRADERQAGLGKQLSEAIANRQMDVSERDKRISSLMTERDMLIVQLSTFKSKAMESEKSEKSAVEQLTARGSRFFEQINQLTTELTDTRSQLREATKQKVALEQSLVAFQDKRQDIEKETRQMWEEKNFSLTATAAAERSRADKAADELSKIRNSHDMQFQSVETEKASLVAQVSEMSVLFDDYQQRRLQAEQESQVLQVQLNEANDRIEELQAILANVRLHKDDSVSEDEDVINTDDQECNGIGYNNADDVNINTEAISTPKEIVNVNVSEATVCDMNVGVEQRSRTGIEEQEHVVIESTPPVSPAMSRGKRVTQLDISDLQESELDQLKELASTIMQEQIKQAKEDLGSALSHQADLQGKLEQLIMEKAKLEAARAKDREAYKQQMLDYQQRTLTIIEDKERELGEARAASQRVSYSRQSSGERNWNPRRSITEYQHPRNDSGTSVESKVEGTMDSSLLVHRQWGIARDSQLRAMSKEKSELKEALRVQEENVEELRRLNEILDKKIKKAERQDKRENLNIEYLKHIVLKYFSATSGKEHLARAICSVLQCDPEETEIVLKAISGEVRFQELSAKKWFS
eukprot:CFRG1938T1